MNFSGRKKQKIGVRRVEDMMREKK